MPETNEKIAFSQHLKWALEQHSWAKISPTWLSHEFNLRYSGKSISVQTANNWLLGTAIPNQDKLQILAAWLDVSSQWLRFGSENADASLDLSKIHPKVQLSLHNLPEKFAQLSPKQKQLVYELIEALLDTNQN